MTWQWTANRMSPHRISNPHHARLETQAPRVTPQPKPTRGGGLGIFPQPTPQPKPHSLNYLDILKVSNSKPVENYV
ncbi:hypothetical protein Hanom_Chr04g00378351 [Helianthus anomalus]